MKNAILYYYNLNSNDIHQTEKQFKFTVANDNYILMEYVRDPNEVTSLYEISKFLQQNQIYCHEFVPNQSGSFLTIINQIPYVLLKSRIVEEELITLQDIVTFSHIPFQNDQMNHLKRENWGSLWSDKIDYLEYQVSQFGKKHPLVRKSFCYFAGMTETAITLFQSFSGKDKGYLTVSHRRIKTTDTVFDLYNPLGFILDCRMRDASEYFKERFFIQENLLPEIKYYMEIEQLSVDECQMFFTRMLYPSFYFDAYEGIIDQGKDEKNLLFILDKVEAYEQFLKSFYYFLRERIPIPDIEWFLKMS